LRLRGGGRWETPDQQAKHWTKLKNGSHLAMIGEFCLLFKKSQCASLTAAQAIIPKPQN
jgi:hypothetical protein